MTFISIAVQQLELGLFINSRNEETALSVLLDVCRSPNTDSREKMPYIVKKLLSSGNVPCH
jgi:hypothetical protein